jgi:hypothetical protein
MCPHTALYASSYCSRCVLLLLHMCPHTALYVSSYCSARQRLSDGSSLLCPHTALYVSSYCSICVLILQCEAEGFRRITPSLDRPDVMSFYKVRSPPPERDNPPYWLLNMWPFTRCAIYHICVSSYCYICVLILLYMCPHTYLGPVLLSSLCRMPYALCLMPYALCLGADRGRQGDMPRPPL